MLGLAGMVPGPATRKLPPQHQYYPYLLRGVAVTHPNQVWSTDIRLAGPHQGWSWDITQLKGPVKWTYCYRYVITAVFSH